jgi:Uma2 family endonuclease
MTALKTAKLTLEQYHQMVDAGILDDCRVELLNGELIEMSPEGEPHAYYNTDTRDYLIRLLGETVLVRDAKPITLPLSASEPELDLAIVQPLGREYLQHHPYPENIFWLIEYSYTSLKKDLEPKAKIYAAAGIIEYWVVNLKTLELVVMRDPMRDEYQTRFTIKQGIVNPVAFPSVALLDSAIAVERLFS